MSGLVREFKEFAMRGNVVDLAIGVVIGAAFGKIIDSLVGDLIMPVLGAITGGLDFSNYYLRLSSRIPENLPYAEAKKAGAALGWGNFITVVVGFLLVALALFAVMKVINRFRRQTPDKTETAAPTRSEALLSEIRDLLAARR